MVALPIVADGAAILAILILLPDLAQGLEVPSGKNSILLVLFYLLFCIGVYLIRKLTAQEGHGRWQPPAALMSPKVRAVLAFLFGLLMMTTLAYQIGYFESILSIATSTLDEGDSSALFVYMPGALLGFSMLYILILAFPVQETLSPANKRFPAIALAGLLLTNSMLIFTSAQARALTTALSLPDGLGIAATSFLVLMISFAPPRLLYQARQPSPYALVTFLLLLLTAVGIITV